MLRGILTPNLVPFKDDGSINEGELRRIVNWLIEKGVSGLYPNGSTGEFIRLSFEERKRVIKIVAEENRGRVPILAGATESNLTMILEACRTYADLGCCAVSITGPYYYKVSQESIEHFFREVAKRSPIDILLYNFPQFSNEISVPVVTRLAMDCPRIVGIKDSSRDFPRFLNTLHAIKPQRPDFSCLIGCEEILFPALLMGADGGTIASSGVVPEVIMKLHREFQAGNPAEAQRIQFKLLDLINAMLYGTNFPEGFRAGMSLRGFNLGTTRQLLSPREQFDLEDIRSKIACILADCGFSEAASACRQPGCGVTGSAARPAEGVGLYEIGRGNGFFECWLGDFMCLCLVDTLRQFLDGLSQRLRQFATVRFECRIVAAIHPTREAHFAEHHFRSGGKVFVEREGFADVVGVSRRLLPDRAGGNFTGPELAEHDDVSRDFRAGVLFESVVWQTNRAEQLRAREKHFAQRRVQLVHRAA